MQGAAPFPSAPGGGLAPFPNWQGPFAGAGPLGPSNLPPMVNGPGGWPGGPEMSIAPPLRAPQLSPQPGPGFAQSAPFLPQPSQWPFVDTAGMPPPQGGPGVGWGQGLPQQGPPMPPPPGAGGPNQPFAQGPIPAVYSQWLPSTLGSVALPPSPPWTAPGTIIGGPQLSPQGPWSAGPLAFDPPKSNGAIRPGQSAIPQYIRSGYDASVSAAQAQAAKNANPFSRTGQNPSSSTPRFVVPDSQTPILEPSYTSAEVGWTRDGSVPSLTSFNVPPPAGFQPNYPPQGDASQAFEIPAYTGTSSGTADYVPLPYQPPNDADPAIAAGPLIRGRDIPSPPIPSDPSEYDLHPGTPGDLSVTTQIPTTTQTDDPYALNPNIIFGGPASITFPEITLGAPQPGFPENGSSSSLSVSSVRIGDILSFPHGTGFGAIPPPAVGMKKVSSFSSRIHADDARLSPDHIDRTSAERPKAPAAATVIKVIPIGATSSEEKGRLEAVRVTTMDPPTTSVPPENGSPNQVGTEQGIRSHKGVKHSQSVSKTGTGSLTDAILQQVRILFGFLSWAASSPLTHFQIQDLKVVLYGRTNCSVCLETETLLKNYSIPVYYFELDSDAKGEQMLTIVQQMTHSLEMPLTFICGRFVGGEWTEDF